MMRRLAMVAAILAMAAAPARAQPAPPELTQAVNDFAGVVDAESANALEEVIRRLQQASGDVIVVATVPTFQPWPDLPSYAVKMFENAGKGIGAKGDTGALVVLAVDDRQVRVEVGYGLEGFVTDGFAGETSRDTMVPFFRRGEYGAGLLAGVTRLAGRIADARGVDLGLAPAEARPRDRGARGSSRLISWMVLFILLLNAVGRWRRRRRGGWASGVGAFGAGSAWSHRGGWGSSGGFGGGFGGFGGGRSGGGGGGASW